ncbi:MAG: (2Fe-2S)-binding protein [Sphingomicrobium sp.]
MSDIPRSSGQFRRLGELDRAEVMIEVDGKTVTGLVGDSVLITVLNSCGGLRKADFGGGNRAGFCLMGACQDCWMWTADGNRLRACTTPVSEGLQLITTSSGEDLWPIIG